MPEEKIPEKLKEILKEVVAFRARKQDPKKDVVTETIHIGTKDRLEKESDRYLRRGWSVYCGSVEIDPDEQRLCDEMKGSLNDLERSYEFLKREMAHHLTPAFRADREATIARRKEELRALEKELADLKQSFYKCVLERKPPAEEK